MPGGVGVVGGGKTFDLFCWAGGYWSREGAYLGGESHEAGTWTSEGFTKSGLMSIVTAVLGYEDNMSNISWFPPDQVDGREELDDEVSFRKAALFGIATGALTFYIVRKDDPYLETRMVPFRSFSDDEEGEDDDISRSTGSRSTGENVGDRNQEEGQERVHEEDGNDGEEDANGDGMDLYVNDNSAGRMELDDTRYKQFEVGQEYRTIDSFKEAINKYAVKKKKNIKYKKSDATRVLAICADAGCDWRIYGSINSASARVVVRSLYEKHECTWAGKVTLLTNTRLAAMYIEDFRENPDLSATQLQKKLIRRNIYLPWTKCERTRLKCLAQFDREQAEQFGRLHDYVYELKRSNPGSTVECEVRQSVFHRFYICFAGLKDGWKAACRRILHVDGTFLKWRMNGMLLVACGRDPNDQMFPVAWGIVDVESKDSWLWFFEHLAEDLELGTGNGLTLASDQQKGLIGAVKELLPYAEHRMCARHVHACWKKKHSGSELQDLFWAAADAYYPLAFDRKMKELHEYDPAARADLNINVFYPWSRAYFSEFSKCDAVENNLGESFNAAIRIARTKPIVEMLEEIRKRVMTTNDKKRLEAERVRGQFTPRAVALLDWQVDQAKHCFSLSCGLGKYEVKFKEKDSFIVHLRDQVSCTCRQFLVSGIPCSHICSALRLEKQAEQDPKSLISLWFTNEKLKRCYQNGLNPVNGMNLWKITTEEKVKPPPFKSPGGRPKGKKRRREKGEKEPSKLGKRGIKMHCSNCGQEGHTKLKCTNPHKPKPPKKPAGRPRVRQITDTSTNQSNQTSSTQPPLSVASSQPNQGFRVPSFNNIEAGSSSQPPPFTEHQEEDLPSLSSALPKRKRGRPRKVQPNLLLGSSSQAAPLKQPIYDKGPSKLPQEGYGIFTSPDTGDDYIQIGRSVVDTADNTILPSHLYSARDKKKLAVTRGRGRGRGRGRVSSSQP